MRRNPVRCPLCRRTVNQQETVRVAVGCMAKQVTVCSACVSSNLSSSSLYTLEDLLCLPPDGLQMVVRTRDLAFWELLLAGPVSDELRSAILTFLDLHQVPQRNIALDEWQAREAELLCACLPELHRYLWSAEDMPDEHAGP